MHDETPREAAERVLEKLKLDEPVSEWRRVLDQFAEEQRAVGRRQAERDIRVSPMSPQTKKAISDALKSAPA